MLCRKRKSHYGKPVNYYSRRNKHHQQQHYLRNPFVVFFLSFVVLGSLRFRVRTKKAAQTLIQRGRQRIISGGNNNNIIVRDNHHHHHEEQQPHQGQQQDQQQDQQRQQPILLFPASFTSSSSNTLLPSTGSMTLSTTTATATTAGAFSTLKAKTTTAASVTRTIAYEVSEERGRNNMNARILRYRAVWVDQKNEMILTTNTHHTAGTASKKQQNPPPSSFTTTTTTTPERIPVTVAQWVQLMLLSQTHRRPGQTQQQQQQQQQEHLFLLDHFIHTLQNGNSFMAYFFETKGVTAASAVSTPFEFVLVDAPELWKFVSTTTAAGHGSGSTSSGIRSRHEAAPTTPAVFADQFRHCKSKSWCVFANLGEDAMLVAPKPLPSQTKKNPLLYSQLASFVRHAPYSQVREFWIHVLQTYAERLHLVITDQSNNNGDEDEEDKDEDHYEWLSFFHLLGATRHHDDAAKESTTPAHDKNNTTNSNNNNNISNHNSRPVWLSTSGMGVPWLHMRLDQVPKYYTYEPFAQHPET